MPRSASLPRPEPPAPLPAVQADSDLAARCAEHDVSVSLYPNNMWPLASLCATAVEHQKHCQLDEVLLNLSCYVRASFIWNGVSVSFSVVQAATMFEQAIASSPEHMESLVRYGLMLIGQVLPAY